MKKALLFKRALRVSLVFLFLGSYALPAEPRRITFGYSTIGPMAAGAWMAKDIGAFEKYGMQAGLIYISSGPVVVQALIGLDLHGGIAATNAVIAAVLRGDLSGFRDLSGKDTSGGTGGGLFHSR